MSPRDPHDFAAFLVSSRCVRVCFCGAALLLLLSVRLSAFGQASEQMLAVGDRIDVRLDTSSVIDDDAFIRRIFAAGDSDRFGVAAEAYLRLLSDPHPSGPEREIVNDHLRVALVVMPPGDRPDAAALSAGEQVARWWRRQDPFPASRRNERLEEHLSRWMFALETFENGEDERGFDDRGEIYVRLGPPGKRHSVQLSENMIAFDFTNSVVVPSLPDNEIWVYRHVHDEAYYFFVSESRRAGYRLSRPSDMIPARLREGLDYRSRRGRQKSDVLLAVMDEVYGQLALAHPIFGSTYDGIAGFRGLPLASYHSSRPDLFARSTLSSASSLETESAGRRNDIVPASFSGTRGMTEDLPIEARWARFLDADGTTRTEIYWSVDTAELKPSRRLEKTLEQQGFSPSSGYLLAVSVAQQTPDYRQRDVQTRHYLLDPARESKPRVQSMVVRGDTGSYHIAAQFTQHWTEMLADGGLAEGAILKVATFRADALDALHGEGERLEMSDLKPVMAGSSERPYPFIRFDRSASPELFFELYNLHFGADDRTHYSIEYEVARAADDRQAVSTSARITSSGTERTAREQIGVDLSDWSGEGDVRITVRVTDEVTSEEIARSITFSVVP